MMRGLLALWVAAGLALVTSLLQPAQAMAPERPFSTLIPPAIATPALLVESPPIPGVHLVEVAGVLRPDGAGNWYLDNTGTHASLGIDYVEVLQSPPRIRLYLLFNATQAVTAFCTGDEQFAVRGWTCGASSGLSTMDLYLGKPNGYGGYTTLNPATIWWPPSCNLWVYGKFWTAD